MTEVTKVCSVCKQPKPLSAFNRRSSNKDKLFKECKACQSVIRRKQTAEARAARQAIVRHCKACQAEIVKPGTNQIYCERCADERAKYQRALWHRNNKRTQNPAPWPKQKELVGVPPLGYAPMQPGRGWRVSA